ncbi:39258_t:CDS:1, partial [Gigaspora margarita]
KIYKIPIMNLMKDILYAATEIEMMDSYNELKVKYYHLYPKLQRHFELLWSQQHFWAILFRSGLPIRGNNTNNYVERSFGLLKDTIFART